MPIQRCNQCGHTGEVLDILPGTAVACPSCKGDAPVYDTTFFVRRLLQQYGALHQEVRRLRSLQDIEKYLKLRKRLGIDRSQFIIYSPDLGEEQAAALSNMYELTFANRERLTAHLRSLL